VATKVNDLVPVTLRLNDAADVTGAPMLIRWDPKVLLLVDVRPGSLFTGGGQQPVFTRNRRDDAGEVTVQLSRPPGAAGVNGSGDLIRLEFRAVGRGSTQVSVPELNLRNSQSQPVLVAVPSLGVTVQ
jgi:hypothetical protein